jgi:hypothetical protein
LASKAVTGTEWWRLFFVREHMIKLTETREITPYVCVHPDEER